MQITVADMRKGDKENTFFSVLWTDLNAYEKEKQKARRLN